MDERRKQSRKYLGFFTRVFNRDTGALLGNLGDITVDGAMVISQKPIPTGVTCNLRIDLPETAFAKDHLDAKAQSIWCKPDIVPEYHNTGFKFLEIDTQDIQIIQQIIRKYMIR